MDFFIENICAHVNVEKTKELYRVFSVDSEDNSGAMNFRKNLYMRKEKMEDYLSPFGIDISKYQELSVVSIDQPRQAITYCGYYPINIENVTELKGIVNSEHYESTFCVIKTNFGFEFSFEYINEQIVLFFLTELPWLFMPPIASCKFENKVALPVICIG